MRRLQQTSPTLFAACLLTALIAACGGGSGGSGAVNTTFSVKNTGQGVASTTPILTDGNFLIYLASEASSGAGGTNFNGDSDMTDAVPVRVDTATGVQAGVGVAVTKTLVASQTLALVNGTLFMVVEEAEDERDWDGDTVQDDFVILTQRPGGSVVFLDKIVTSGFTFVMGQVGDRLYYTSATAPAASGDTNLFMTRVAVFGGVPSTPTMVTTSIVDVGLDGLSVKIGRTDGGVLFLMMDEIVEGEDLNGDTLVDDTAVLALLNGRTGTGQIHGTSLAVSSPFIPVRARTNAAGDDILAAFLVNEAGQGVNLNDPVDFAFDWPPLNCSLVPDTDMLDDVLHFVLMSELAAGTPPTNTGLVGRVAAGSFVYIHGADFIGVSSLELDEGTDPGGDPLLDGCDLNGDGDKTDLIFRWVEAKTPVLPVTSATKLLALTTGLLPGASADTTGSIVVIDDFWVLQVDEAEDGRDRDGGGLTSQLIGVHNPSNIGTQWNFDHGAGAFVGGSWMAQDPRTTASFFVAFREDVFGQDKNGDGDMLDSTPTIPGFESASTLKFPGFGVAIAADNAGLAKAGGVLFYRVSEAGEGKDINGDGDQDDFMLQRIGVTTNDLPTFMGTLNDLGRPAVHFQDSGTAKFGAFITDETVITPTGTDVNGDGAIGLIVRYFRMPQ